MFRQPILPRWGLSQGVWVRRQIQHPLGQDEPVGGHHHHIGLGGQQRIAGGGSVFGVFAVQPQAARLGHSNAVRPARIA